MLLRKLGTLVLSLVLLSQTIASAAPTSLKKDETEAALNFDVNNTGASKAAVYFMLNDIVYNNESGWDNSCKISSVTPLYGLDEDVTTYVFNISKGSQPKGYIVVAANTEMNPVVEFSYSAKSPIENLEAYTNGNSKQKKLHYLGNLNYFSEYENNDLVSDYGEKQSKDKVKKFFNVNKSDKANNKQIWGNILKANDSVLKDFFVGDNGNGEVISDPAIYLQNTWNSAATYFKDSSNTKLLDYVGNWLQKDYETSDGVGKTTGSGVNNCTLSSLSNIFIYFSANGWTKVPLDKSAIYSKVRAEAVSLGYTPSGGLGVTKNNNLVTNSWKAFGYTNGSGSTSYTWSFSSIRSEIDNNKPVLFSLASGQYYNHTVAVRGYTKYKTLYQGTIASYTHDFYVVHDNWNSGDRYIYATTSTLVGAATYITPATPK
ncbi:MAG: Spi family protease inhibitor [Clostridia bacterium]|nr:Spi family protease inhibitor [Clostridia bacterium]